VDIQEVEYGCTDWIELAQVSDTCEYDNESLGSIKCEEFLDWLRTG